MDSFDYAFFILILLPLMYRFYCFTLFFWELVYKLMYKRITYKLLAFVMV